MRYQDDTMLAYLIFIVAEIVLDLYALMIRGKLFSMVFAAVAVGFAVIALALMVAPTTQTISPIVINTPNGTILVNSYNQTASAPTTVLNLLVGLGTANVFIQVGWFVLMVGYLFFKRKRERRKKFDN